MISLWQLKGKCSPNGDDVCKNGGTCQVDGKGMVTCSCSKEYKGQHCEIGKLLKWYSIRYKDYLIIVAKLQ